MSPIVSNIALFRKVARLCRLSYHYHRDSHALQRLLDIAPERAQTEFFKNFDTGAQGLIHTDHEEKVIYVIYAGTQDLTDWGVNLRAIKRPHGLIKIHRGVRDAIRSVRQPVLISVETYRDYSIVLGGHSLGGMCAAAMCISLTRRYKGQKSLVLVTLGAGKIGSTRDMNEAIRCPHYRFQNGSDAVPRQPMVPFMYGHANAPNNVHVYFPNAAKRLGHYVINPSALTIALDVAFTFFERFRDHDARDYEAKLEEVVP